VSMGGISAYIPQQVQRAASVAYNRVDFAIGDRVRLRLKRQFFDKGGTRFTKTLHTIESYSDGLYNVSDRVTGYRKVELLKVAGDVETAPLPAEPDDLEERKEDQVVDRRVSRRVRFEGVDRNDAPPPTDEERSLRAVRRRPADRGFYLG
jgi:hypothetical protein